MAAKRRYERRAPAQKKPKLHVPEPTLKLDLGCGQNCKEGFEGVDLYAPNAKHRFDLWSGERWPFDDNSIDELFSSHTIEHIEGGNRWETYSGQRNLFFFFFEEAWRIAKPGAVFSLQWPALQSVRAFMDPTHCRAIPQQMMLYLDKNWLEMQKLSHCTTKACDWVFESGGSSCSIENGKQPAEVQTRWSTTQWNFSDDYFATLRARKPA